MNAETQYAACLLVVGPPTYIHVTHDHIDDLVTIALVRLEYKDRCRQWYSLSFPGLCSEQTWLAWFATYCNWLKENGFGNTTSQKATTDRTGT